MADDPDWSQHPLAKRADEHANWKPPRNALHDAASNGAIPWMEEVLADGEDIEVKTNEVFGFTPLMMAAMAGQIDAIRYLMSRGANVHAQDHFGNTALMLALHSKQVDTAYFLIEEGVDPRAVNTKGKSTDQLAAFDPVLQAALRRTALQRVAASGSAESEPGKL